MRNALPWLLLMLLPQVAVGDPTTDFWGWFKGDAERIRAAMDDERTRESMAYWLGRVAPGLSYELRQGKRKRQLILSADGNMARFVTVENIVRAAPRIKGWKFIALRPSEKRPYPVVVGDVRLDPEVTYFDLYQDTGRLGVVLYLPEFDAEHVESYRIAARRLLCQVLGERKVGQEIGFIDFDDQQVRDMQFSRPFSEFREVFDVLLK